MTENIKRVDPKLKKRLGKLLQDHLIKVGSPLNWSKRLAWLVENDVELYPVTCMLLAHSKDVIRFTNRLSVPPKRFGSHPCEIHPAGLEVTLHKCELDDNTLRKVIEIFSGSAAVREWDLIQNNRGYGNYSRKAWLACQGLPLSLA